ncbi:hypothetical protein HBI56_005980 [Parastagonospora nodorum]|nr:hypothetical protein HBH51_037900 [Parastagonospora nodorum]KAH4005429.1 hypothetical protein HBI10_032700 [Parastagonospora nodorum]KAH4033120.1 hypothetical protein HBI13_006400 [Parastagonospora nodorum]KAH4041924.1 hypothetical protein HBI09_006300 [Parastagonospora nodorum]KAH4073555.1 hypothetical protein HBH50_055700 [Parastagonospora nodorum]
MLVCIVQIRVEDHGALSIMTAKTATEDKKPLGKFQRLAIPRVSESINEAETLASSITTRNKHHKYFCLSRRVPRATSTSKHYDGQHMSQIHPSIKADHDHLRDQRRRQGTHNPKTHLFTSVEKTASQLCGDCRSSLYCLKACQKIAWVTRKPLCKTLQDFQDQHRPAVTAEGDKYSRAIRFDPANAHPQFIKSRNYYADSLELSDRFHERVLAAHRRRCL